MPTAEETDKFDDLSELVKRPEDLPQTASSGSGVSVDLMKRGYLWGGPGAQDVRTRCLYLDEGEF
jgi:hypothetical protein